MRANRELAEAERETDLECHAGVVEVEKGDGGHVNAITRKVAGQAEGLERHRAESSREYCWFRVER